MLVRKKPRLDALDPGIARIGGRKHRRRRVNSNNPPTDPSRRRSKQAGSRTHINERRPRSNAKPQQELNVRRNVESGLRVVASDERRIAMLSARERNLTGPPLHLPSVTLIAQSAWTRVTASPHRISISRGVKPGLEAGYTCVPS